MNEIQLLQKIAKYVQLVHDTRQAQKQYFKTRTKDDLVRSKGLEAKMDMQNAEVLQAANACYAAADCFQKFGGSIATLSESLIFVYENSILFIRA